MYLRQSHSPRLNGPRPRAARGPGGLPPAWVTCYQVDPNRDEGLDYARRLTEAGVSTEVHQYSGPFHMAHEFPGTAIGPA
jgi:acetyl esterase/lipase